MDFKNKIREKYNAEVIPSFEDKSWDSFLAHKRKKEKKPMPFFLYLTGIAAMVLVGTLLLAKEKDEVSTNETTNNLTNLLTEDLNSNQSERVIAPSDVINEVSKEAARDHAQIKMTELNKVKNTSPKLTNSSDSELASAPIISAKTNFLANNNLDHSTDQPAHKSTDLPENKDEIASTSLDSESTIRDEPGLVEKLPIKNFDLKQGHLVDHTFSPIDFGNSSKSLWQKYGRTILAYGGISFPLNVETIEEQAHQFGARLYYNLNEHIRAKSGLEFALISFRSNSINPALGVEYVESPSDIVTFNNAIVESLNLSWDLGFDALVFSRKNLKGYLGISYQIAVELDKEIEYNFNGDDDNDSDDDIHVAIKDIKKYFVPHIIRLETGLQYETPIGGLNFSVGFPYQLSKIKLELLSQVQLNIGFTRNF